MMQLLSRGWKLVYHNKLSLTLVGLYQLIWTFILFILIERIISPLVRALPDNSISPNASHYFWQETKFIAAKTDLLMPYLYILLALLLIRMIAAPFLQSGLFGTLANSNQHAIHNQFLSQLKANWKPYTIIYWIKSVLILLPTIFVLTPVIKAFVTNYFTLSLQDLPLINLSLLLLWTITVRSITYSLLIGISNHMSWQQSLITFLKKLMQLLAIFLLVFMFSSLLLSAFQLTSMLIASFVSTIMFFATPIVQTFMKAWTISTHTIQLSE